MRSFVKIQMFSDLNQIEMEGERGKTGKIKDSFPGRLLRGLHVFLPLRSLMSNGFRIYFSRSTQTPESSRRRCSRERAPSNFEDHVPLRAQLSYWKSFDSRAVLEEPPLISSTKLSIGFAAFRLLLVESVAFRLLSVSGAAFRLPSKSFQPL